MILQMLCYTLDSNGFEAVGAVDGSEALTKACGSTFDVLVLDNMMPGMSGEQLAHRLLLLGCADPSRIVMITGGLVPADTTFAHAVLQKPFGTDEFLSTIRSMTMADAGQDPP